MYLVDSHTHSSCSPDGTATMTQMVQGAVAAGVQELTITDHCDLLSMEGKIDLEFDWEPLRQQFTQAKPVAEAAGLKLNYGIEIGGAADFPDVANRILEEDLDFVLASVHNLSVASGCKDFYDIDFRGKPELCRQCLDDYFTSMEDIVAQGNFDSLAHVPYLLRYMRDRDGMDVSLAPYEDRIRAMLRHLIQTGKALELNTCRGKSVEDYRELFTWYRQEGGRLVTIGSDAHRPQDIGKGIAEGQELLWHLGFDWYCVYHQRKPVSVPIREREYFKI